MNNNTKAVLLALLCTAIVSGAQIFLKKGSEQFSLAWPDILQQIYNYPLVAGALLYAVGAVFFLKAFKFGELSVVYPVMASSYVIVTLLSVYFLDESIGLQKWIGIGLITGGVILIGKSGAGAKRQVGEKHVKEKQVGEKHVE